MPHVMASPLAAQTTPGIDCHRLGPLKEDPEMEFGCKMFNIEQHLSRKGEEAKLGRGSQETMEEGLK